MCPQLLYRLFFALCLVQVTGCSIPEQEQPDPSAVHFQPEVPANLASAVPHPDRNPFTREGVELGRMLFYDPLLSGNGKVSCATCHQQEKAFSDGTALTLAGVSGKPLLRHVPSLANLAWMEGLFWDGGVKDLESLSFAPILHPDEMGQNLKELVQKLQNHKQYPKLFKEAFGTDSITTVHVAHALAQFQRTIISADSRYDRYVRGEGNSQLSSLELEGLALFKKHCSSCHATDFFTDNGYHNNGLDAEYSDAHESIALGRGRISRQTTDIGKYKTPTLRNIAITAPYMHDGRFKTLEEVLDHYSHGVTWSPSLAPQLQEGTQPGIALTPDQKQKIILFLNTLTDNTFIQNRALASPF